MKQKVIIFHSALAPYRIDFFNFMHDNYDLLIYFESDSVNTQRFDQSNLVKSSNFHYKILSCGFNVKSTSFRFGILDKIIKNNPNIIITNEFGFITMVVSLYKLFFFKTFKHYIISDDNIGISKMRTGLRAVFRTKFSSMASGVIYSSDNIGQWNRKHISSKINPLTLPIIHDSSVFRKKLLASHTVAKNNITKYQLIDKKVLLYVGRLISIKNIPLIIEEMAHIEDSVLFIVGRGELLRDLSKQVLKHDLTDKVFFIGFQSGNDLYSWFSIAHILILPSYFEPYGAVVNEALIGGCYVLCSKIAGASNLINDNNGATFDPNDKFEYHNKLKFLLSKVQPILNDTVLLRQSRMPMELIDHLTFLKNQL
jgi:glycosyltransferase involved in cell wall biosynthesis